MNALTSQRVASVFDLGAMALARYRAQPKAVANEEGMKLIRLPQVIERVALRKTTIYERIKQGAFPQPIKLGTASVWVEQEVDEWLEKTVKERRG